VLKLRPWSENEKIVKSDKLKREQGIKGLKAARERENSEEGDR
jgi:hypothetical protein